MMLKGSRCNFKHLAQPSQKSRRHLPCPFLEKDGYCLKKNKCYFSRDKLSDNNPFPKPYADSRVDTESFLPYHQAPVAVSTTYQSTYLVSK